jgi:hypothetical protein
MLLFCLFLVDLVIGRFLIVWEPFNEWIKIGWNYTKFWVYLGLVRAFLFGSRESFRDVFFR